MLDGTVSVGHTPSKHSQVCLWTGKDFLYANVINDGSEHKWIHYHSMDIAFGIRIRRVLKYSHMTVT